MLLTTFRFASTFISHRSENKVTFNRCLVIIALELLVQNLHRLSESDPDENAAVYNTLATIENLIEVKPAVAELVCEKTNLLEWLLGKIKVREFDGNKQYALEILAILLQSSSVNQKKLGQMNGVEGRVAGLTVAAEGEVEGKEEAMKVR